MSGGLQVAVESSEKKWVVMRMDVVVVVCSAVGFLGLLIVILGVASENATAQALVPDELYTDGMCVYRTTPALGCGIVAALLALTAQVAVTAASLCGGCCRTWELPTETRRIAGIVLATVSWIIVIIVVALFIAGAAMNTDQERQPTADVRCPVDPGSAMFAAATVFSLVATGLQIASYVLLQAKPNGSTKPLATQQPELATGQPVQLEPQQDAEEVVAGGDPPPASAPPSLSEATEPTSQV
ncbi:hypothetical protein BAE44_0024995 [Dichanthelium oligosanthes]|uniref:Uncharacterized protein n=1 Tax=Dichanthelium oligosanthes TaxID=888268 RepID=A0A1E5UM99_9POAL|nr:hypothetical protein BAE44_0024995 [Dichanthelium oligosanthes]